MNLLNQATELLQQQPYTLDTARQLALLESQAQGEEAECIGQMWETLMAGADEALLDALQRLEDGQL
ncbi:hypothetical protein [Ferrimonas balearica]|uniref:hypothetical protein n=1 Tax=Ferrimonas balearica TaxID=44012 RepID=UPI001C9425EB|nr:hypothetical protein [Ferrimonas balearica]MBY6223570.1 hypothetical protein [Ferrimonas balearica]